MNHRVGATAAIIAIVLVLSPVASAAASLLTVTAKGLAAGNGTVARCDTNGVAIAYTNSYDSTTANYRTTTITVSEIDSGCTGATIELTIRETTGAAIYQTSATIAATTLTFTPSPTIVPNQIAGWAVNIKG